MPMFVTWGPDRSFFYNDIYAKIAGEKFQSALGQKFETVWSEIWDHLLPLVQKVESGESIYLENVKLLFRRSLNEKEEKEEAYFTFSYSPIRSSLGTIDGLFCAVVETTKTVVIQREQSIENADIDLAHRKLQESEENLKLAIRGGRLGTWLINFEEERITFDEKTKELHGILHNDDLKDVFTRQVHPGDRYKVNEALYSTLNKGTIFEVEYRAMHSSGNYRWVYARGEPKLNKKGKVISTSGVVSDITERKNACLKLSINHFPLSFEMFLNPANRFQAQRHSLRLLLNLSVNFRTIILILLMFESMIFQEIHMVFTIIL